MEATRTWRFAFGSLLAFTMTVGSLPAFAIGTLAPFIVVEFEIPRASIGLLVSVLFLIAAVGSLAAGPAVDHLDGRHVLIALFAMSGFVLIAMGIAPTYPWVVAAVALSGLVSSWLNPTTNKLISLHIPPGRRGAIMGVKQSGVQGASFLAGLLLPSLAVLMGWRAALIVTSALAVVGITAAWLTVPRSEPHPTGLPHRPLPRVRLGQVVGWLSLYAFLMGSGVAAIAGFLVIYAVESVGMAKAQAGLVAALIGLSGMIARVVWAQRSERMHSASAPLATLALLGVIATGLLWVANDRGVWLLWVSALLFGTTTTAWNSVGNLLLVRELPSSVAGRAAGIMNLGFYGGFVASPVIFGWLVDVYGTYGPAWMMVAGFYAVGAAVAVLWERRKEAAARADQPAGDKHVC